MLRSVPNRAEPLAWNQLGEPPKRSSATDGSRSNKGARRKQVAGSKKATSRKLSPEGIVATAMRVADTDGLDAVTIRRLASDLNVKPMSLYVHIATKDDLLALMMDEVVGEMLIDKPLPDDWRAALSEIARKSHAAYAAHPWVLEAFARGSRLGPNALQHARQQSRAVSGMGLPAEDVWMIVAIIDDFVIGNAQRVATRVPELSLEHLLSPGDLAVSPELVALPAASRAGVADKRFEIGLEGFLDMIEARLLAPGPKRQSSRARKPRTLRTAS